MRSISKNICRSPRHIEIQVLGDGRGDAIHLGERDCSLQRRHQKVLEESPSPALNDAQRERIGEICAKAMREMKYLGAGTVEFLLRGRRVLFHRDEYPHPGRASGDRDDHRHRSRAGADPGRGRRRPALHARTICASTAIRSNAGSMRKTRPPSGPRPARSCNITRRAGLACASIPPSIRATPSRPITTRWSAS